MSDLMEITDEELRARLEAIRAEMQRRRTVRHGERDAAIYNRRFLAAAGIKPGDAWVQPTGIHNAYPKDWEAPHKGKDWISTVSGNVWEPGVSGWREKTAEGPPPWLQPTGAHDAYNTGDRVTFEGHIYTSNMDGNTWSPTAYPAGWTRDPDDNTEE